MRRAGMPRQMPALLGDKAPPTRWAAVRGRRPSHSPSEIGRPGRAAKLERGRPQ